MAISLQTGMIETIEDDSDDRWDGTITYSIDVDYGSIGGDFTGIFTWDPHRVAISVPNLVAIIDAIELWDDVVARGIDYLAKFEDADITINMVDNL